MSEISNARYRAGEGEPLVLVHGFTATWRCWMPVLAELVPRFDVFAPTLHGHDGGPAIPAGLAAHSPAQAADHLEALLDEQSIDTAHFAGNSMGGALSFEMAKRGRARSVVAISPGGGWEEHDRAEPERIVRWFTRNQRMARATRPRLLSAAMSRPGARRLLLRDVMTRGDQVPAAEAAALVRSSVRCTVVDDVFATIRAGTARVVDLDRVACPTLIAWGDQDRILPLEHHSARFRREIAGSEFRVMRGCGHTPMWDEPSLIAAMISDFATAAADSVQPGMAPALAG